jgi:hypothetical protein
MIWETLLVRMFTLKFPADVVVPLKLTDQGNVARGTFSQTVWLIGL